MAAMTNKVCRKAGLPCLEGRYALNSNACYRKHSHPTFSLGVVEMGRARHYQRRHTEVIGPGAVVATQADIVHSCNPRDERRWSYHMLYVDSEWLAQLAADVGAAHRSHPERSPQLPAVIYDRALYREIISINRQLFSDTPVLDTQTRLVELLGGLLHTHNRRHGRQQPAADHPAVRAARDYLHDNALRSVSLTELAAVARLSPYHLIRLFKRDIGLTPHAYQINVRINSAKHLLRRQLPIAEVAAATAFSDQAHFQRCFKHHTAMTPGQYRNAH